MKKWIATLACFCLLSVSAQAQKYVPTPENLQNRKEFAESRLGIFIHWGLYSTFAQGEWYMNNASVDAREYAKAMNGFYPHRFDARQWVSAFKAAGAKYICFTTRHHEGFSMWDTRWSDYNIMNTPYGKDIVRQLAEECHRQGIKLHLYYSHIDWTREDYPAGRTGRGTKRLDRADWPAYYRFMNNQLTELLTNYGEIPSPSTGSWRSSISSFTTCNPAAWWATTTIRLPSRARTSRFSSAMCRARTKPDFRDRTSAPCRSRPARP